MKYIKSKSFKHSSSRGIAVSSILVVISVCCLGIFYLIQTNDLVAKGYQFRELKKHFQELETENQKLQINAVQCQAPANLEEVAKNLKMVEAEKITYLEEKEIVVIKK